MLDNWKQGFIRLWLVGAVCWIGYVGYPKYTELSIPNDTCERIVGDNPAWRPNFGACKKRIQNERDEEIKAAIKMVFAPPVLILLVGIGLWWVAKGFRSSAA